MSPKTRSFYFEVLCVPECCFVVNCPTTLKQTVPSQGGQSTSRGVTLLRSTECLGQTVYFEVKCPGGGLL